MGRVAVAGARLCWVQLVIAASGCPIAANISAPHQPYAPLLDHAGQLDVVVRGGVMEHNGSTVAAQVAYAPIDNLSFAASVDADFDTSADHRARHLGGGLAIGTFVRAPVFRFEAMAGLNGGQADGDGRDCLDGSGDVCTMSIDYDLSGPYLQPFVQALIGFEVPYFEMAGGLRLFGQLTDVSYAATDGTSGRNGFERLFIEPILTIRVPIDIVRFEVLSGFPTYFGGDPGPLLDSGESTTFFYIVVGIGLQLDTAERPFDLAM